MISVPDAGLLPRTPRPVWFMNGSMTSSGKPCGIRRERRRRDHAHHLPVPGRRVLALRALEETAGHRRGTRLRRAALERHDVPEPEGLEVRQVEAADGAGRVAEGVRAFVSVLPCVRQLSSADGVENDDARPRHSAGYSTAALNDALGLLLLVVYIAGIVGIAAAITLAVIKVFPTERNPKSPDKPDDSTPARGTESTGGSLFRRSKRATT